MAQAPAKTKENPEAQEQAPGTEGKASRFGKIKIVLFVGLVVAVECIAVYFYLPSAAENAALAGSALDDIKGTKAESGKEGEKEENGPVEVDLGEFNVTAYQPTSNTTLRIDFHMFGTVADADKKEFLKLLEENLHRFRDQVIVTVRSSEITDLTDAGLGLVKRKILDKTNRILGKQLLQSIIFSDFAFIEQ
jgi:flagellar basal body-associated protein FliL